jgi:hypothetical protein
VLNNSNSLWFSVPLKNTQRFYGEKDHSTENPENQEATSDRCVTPTRTTKKGWIINKLSGSL